MIGKTIGHYKILRQIGVGGMGEVYAAEDTTLDREVALKLLPPEMAADPERRERFDREAKTIAALDHPNIVTIHTVEHAEAPNGGNVHFITMQLVEGKTLTDLIPAGGLSVERFFALAVPLAEAVAVAHEQGITHRDLKPGNVMVADDGRLKVLDFGLAKLAESEREVAAEPEMATVAATGYQAQADLTEEGKVLGTVAYMSPEQAEGKVVDHRSDIFSLGIILYQMATGSPPFQGDTKLSIMSSIVKETPTSITDLNRALPRHLARIIRKCLEKDPARRYQSTLDLKNDLEDLKGEVASGEALPFDAAGTGAGQATGGVPWMWIGGAVVATALVAVWAASWFGSRGDGRGASTATRWRTSRLTNLPGVESQPSLSPDGEQFVFTGDAAGDYDIYMQRVGGGRVFNLTEGSDDDDFEPAYSPDGSRIAFRSNRDGGGIYLMGATGEDVRRLVDDGFAPAWSPDGSQIVYANQTFQIPWQLNSPRHLYVADVATGETRVLTDEGLQPAWSPNGHRIAYFAIGGGGQRDVWTIGADGEEPVPVTADEALDWSPRWSPDGEHLYFSSNRGGTHNIWRVAIDERTGALGGEPEAVTTGGTNLQGYLSLAGDGRSIAYASTARSTNVMRVEFDPRAETVIGDPRPVTSGPRDINSYDVSADDQWVVFRSTFPQEDLILIRTDGSGETKLTNDTDRDRTPVFSPDGQRVYFYSDRGGSYQAWSIRTDGTDLMMHAVDEPFVVIPVLSPDGHRMALSAGFNTLIVDLTQASGEAAPERLPLYDATHGLEARDWSPDGTKLAGALITADNRRDHPAIYSFETGEYTVFDEIDSEHPPMWLSDNRRALVSWNGNIFLLDTATGEHRELLSSSSDRLFDPVVGPEDGVIYFLQNSTRSDIYLLTAEEGERQ